MKAQESVGKQGFGLVSLMKGPKPRAKEAGVGRYEDGQAALC